MYPILKRMMDIGLAALGLFLVAPLMLLIAFAIWLDSPGPVIFSQPRFGRGGRVFRMHKFRKFPANWGDQGAAVTVAGDARMTRLGHILERSKFDEIPQLWNVLKGEMSFVGPRPETLGFRDLFQGEFAGVHAYPPGIFGPNQVAFRNESKMYPPDQDPETFYREVLFPQKARNDLAYFARATVLSDLLLMLRGLWCSVMGAVDWRTMVHRRLRPFLADVVLLEVAWFLANLVRFEGWPPGLYWETYLTGIWLMPVVVLPVMVLGRCYRGVVRHFSVGDAMRLGVSGFVGWMLGLLVLMRFFDSQASLGVVLLAYLLSVGMMGTLRLLYRERWRRFHRAGNHSSVRLAIYGAGRRGMALATLIEDGFPQVQMIGFLDDNDREMRGRGIGGRRILGSERDLESIQSVHNLNQLWTTFDPEIRKYRRLLSWCAKNGVRLVVLPATQPFLGLLEAGTGSAGDALDERPYEEVEPLRPEGVEVAMQ
jgi:lipopolysaccharide/colanic/teichoic acid biosynthesis glycosyltransferase